MKLPGGSNKLLFVYSAAIALFLGLLLLFFFQLKKGEDPRKTPDVEIDGTNLRHLRFDENNEKKLEIRFLESQKKDDDKLFMKKINATIFKADKLEKDIHISADSGYSKNDYNDFHLQGNALIFSPSFTLSSSSFDLKDLDIVSTQDAAVYKLRNITGQAKNGLLYIIKNKQIRMLQVKGVLTRASKPYDFQAQILRLNEKKKSLLLEKNAKVDGAEAAIRGDRISLQYDQDFKNLESASASGNCYFQTFEIDKHGQKQGKEIIADRIKLTYDPEGRPQQISVRGAAKIILADKKNNNQIESDAIEISLRSETQTLEKVRCLTRGKLSNRGQDNVMVSGDSLLALYAKDGVLANIKAEKNCEFSTNDFRGTAAVLNYDAAHFLIDIAGNDAEIISKKNIFNSTRFLIHTESRQLNSNKGVKATIMPEKKNVLLSSKPLFINATEMEMTDKGNAFRFKEKVKLFQDDIEMHAGEMLFDSLKNNMSFKGNADLKFFNENEMVFLRGQTIFFNTPEHKIIVVGDAKLNQAENSLNGRQIELSFDLNDQLETIQAMDNVIFTKKDLSGKSGLVHWYFIKKIILFENSAQITRKGAGTTKGRELLLNLSSNEIKVTSQEDRAETIIKQD